MNKKFILSCMAIGILAGGVYNNVSAVNQTEQGNQQIQECILTQEKAKVLGVDNSRVLVIPEEYTSIGSEAFSGAHIFSSVIVSDKLTSIMYGAFRGSNIGAFPTGGKIKTIGDWAFECCSKLQELNIPDSVEYIGYNAFGSCTNLELDVSQIV